MAASLLSGRVIVVDDDPDVLTAARMALASAVASVEALPNLFDGGFFVKRDWHVRRF